GGDFTLLLVAARCCDFSERELRLLDVARLRVGGEDIRRVTDRAARRQDAVDHVSHRQVERLVGLGVWDADDPHPITSARQNEIPAILVTAPGPADKHCRPPYARD